MLQVMANGKTRCDKKQPAPDIVMDIEGRIMKKLLLPAAVIAALAAGAAT